MRIGNFKIWVMPLIFTFVSAASANEVRVLNPDGKREFANEITIHARPGDKLPLKAALFQAEAREDSDLEEETVAPALSSELVDRRLLPKEFLWKVLCPSEAPGNDCSDAPFPESAEGVIFEVPSHLEENETLRIEVSVASSYGDVKPAIVTIKDGNADPEEDRPKGAKGGKNLRSKEKKGAKVKKEEKSAESPRTRTPRDEEIDRPKKKDKERKGGLVKRGGSGKSGGSSGDSSSSGSTSGATGSGKKSKKSSGNSNRDFNDDFGGGFFGESFGSRGGSGNPSTGMRGYNRNSSTPVISCSHVSKAGGGLELRCEEASKKVLRTRREITPAQREAWKQHLAAHRKAQVAQTKINSAPKKEKILPQALRPVAKPTKTLPVKPPSLKRTTSVAGK